MAKHVEIKKSLLRELIELAIQFDDVWASSYYATNVQLQEDSKRLNELVKELHDEGLI